MISTGSTETNALIEELQIHIQLLSERAAMASGKLAAATQENAALKAKIDTLTPKAPPEAAPA